MKNSVKTISKTVAIVLFLVAFMGLGNSVEAQTKYGRSGYVWVKDTKGNSRVLNTTVVCLESSVSSAKSKIEDRLNSDKKYNEEFDGSIHFTIDQCGDAGDKKSYGGSGSVKVKNTDNGQTRTLNTTIFCLESSVSGAKSKIEDRLNSDGKYNEVFDGPIHYSIDSCDY